MKCKDHHRTGRQPRRCSQQLGNCGRGRHKDLEPNSGGYGDTIKSSTVSDPPVDVSLADEHRESTEPTVYSFEPIAPPFCSRLGPEHLSELKDHGHHPLLQPSSHRGQDVFSMVLDCIPEKYRQSTLQQKAVKASKKLSAKHFSTCKKFSSTESLVEAFVPIFDDLFFFGTLKDYITIEWLPQVEWTNEKEVLRDGYVVNASGDYDGLSVTQSKGIKYRPRCFITLRHDMNSKPCHEDYVLAQLGILLHEMLHGFTERFECKTFSKKCWADCKRLHGITGHPPIFYEVCDAMEFAAENVLGFQLLLNGGRWNRDEGMSRSAVRNGADPPVENRTFVRPGDEGIRIYRRYKRLEKASHDSTAWDTDKVVDLLCYKGNKEELLLELFLRKYRIDGRFAFSFLDWDEVEFWLKHCKKSKRREHSYVLRQLRSRFEERMCGALDQGWLSVSRGKFRDRIRGKRRGGKPLWLDEESKFEWRIDWENMRVEKYEVDDEVMEGVGVGIFWR